VEIEKLFLRYIQKCEEPILKRKAGRLPLLEIKTWHEAGVVAPNYLGG
jgi:hypothetical protein